ncbi:hypothetical protein [Sphingobium sp.]|uniref:hypothetical protein n=1 Tax=Sphingobium sp. TaxID=1912891 RepID=UPI0026168012|nr:hypothetical protein [Sphingobium sp.]
MQILRTLALGVMILSLPAHGQEPTVLWRGLTVGMSKDEVAKALPEKEIDLLADCRTIVSTRFQNDRLYSVVIAPKWIASKNNCIAPMKASLTEKYGDANRTVVTVPGNQFKREEIYDLYLWIAGGIEVEYRSQIGGERWSLIYRPITRSAPPKRIEGL